VRQLIDGVVGEGLSYVVVGALRGWGDGWLVGVGGVNGWWFALLFMGSETSSNVSCAARLTR
jgi:hypothetical protein